MGRTALLLVAAVLVGAPAARAGGDFVDLAVGARVWFVGSGGVRSLDARTGRTISRPQLVGGAYPLSVALAGGAAWVASVENGYVWGTLSRIDLRTGKVSVVWRRRDSSVQYVAAGAGSGWTLIGSPKGMRIARFTLTGRLLRVWPIADAVAAARSRRALPLPRGQLRRDRRGGDRVGCGCARLGGRRRSRRDRTLAARARRPRPPLRRPRDGISSPTVADDTQALWREYRRNRDQHLRDRLILSYAPLVKYVAGRLGSGLPAHVDEGDLVSYGLLGLIGAIE